MRRKRNRNPPLPHAEAMRVHALRRLFERFGLAMTYAEYALLCADIARREPDMRTRSGNPLYTVVIRGRQMYAGWSSAHGVIPTFHTGGLVK